jgi:copper chaperone CopZ
MSERRYVVTGMTCGHCVQAVTAEVSAVPGVEKVDVDLATGRLTVAGSEFTDEQVTAAVAGAGYAVAP